MHFGYKKHSTNENACYVFELQHNEHCLIIHASFLHSYKSTYTLMEHLY